MVARIEGGDREPRKFTKIRLARFFGVTVEWLFYEEYDCLQPCSLATDTERKRGD